MGTATWVVNPRTTRVHTVAPADYPRRQLNTIGTLSCVTNLVSSLILALEIIAPILHPSILLLTKLLPWKEVDHAIQMARHVRACTDINDIRTIMADLMNLL